MATGKKGKRANKLMSVYNKQTTPVAYSQDNRRAEIVEESHYVVKMYVGDTLVEERNIVGHSLRYAEDCAENWENGIIK
jgi:hypothetical protein